MTQLNLFEKLALSQEGRSVREAGWRSRWAINRKALSVLTKTDCILDDSQIQVLASAMALLSRYYGGYRLFDQLVEDASEVDCKNILQECYQAKRDDSDRKNRGRYYTPVHLVRSVNKTTFKPVLPDRLKEVAALPVEQQLSAILKFSTCDIACGSGNFLVVAARQIGVEIARIAFQSKKLTAEEVEFGLLLASENCIYGVDRDPLAVELCKLSLWLNATQRHCLTDLPLPPLTNIRCGDSLTGLMDLTVLQQGIPDRFYNKLGFQDEKSVCAALKKQNRQERKTFKITAKNGSLETLKAACDVYCSIMFIPKKQGALVPTTHTLQCVLNGEISAEQQVIVDHARDVARRMRLFHWKLEFPQVFFERQNNAQSLS